MKKIERKDFLKIGGGAVAGGLTGYVFSGAPFLGFQWLVEWTQDQYIPAGGAEKFVQSLNESCPNKCRVNVRKISDRAIKIESKEGVCPSCLNALQLLYHPERIQKPLKLKGSKGSGKYVEVTWDEAIKDIADKANKAKSGQIASISKTKDLSGQLLNRLVNSTGSSNTYYESNIDSLTSSVLNANIEYDFKKADFILSFGSRIFEGWGNSVEANRALAGWKNKKLIQVDTIVTRTASIADDFIHVIPGTEAILAIGIANYLIEKKHLAAKGTGFASWSQITLNQFPMATVSKLTGVSPDKISEIAEAFYRAGNPVAVAGKGAVGVSSSAIEILAVYTLNSLVKSRSVKLKKNTGFGLAEKKSKAAGIDSFIKNENFDILFVNNADPVYKSVIGNDLVKKMEKAFVVSISPLKNDTSLYADYILPSLTFLETNSSEGTAAVKTKGKAVQAADIIIKIAKKVNKAKNSFPWAGYQDFAGKTQKMADMKGNFSFNISKLKKDLLALKKQETESEFPLSLVPFESAIVGDGDRLAYPYVLKTIDGNIYSDGNLCVHINSTTADKYGVSENESIKIASKRGKTDKVKVHITDTVAPDVVAIPLGFGHKAYTKYARGKGVNPKEIMSDKIDPLSGTANWWVTRVKIS